MTKRGGGWGAGVLEPIGVLPSLRRGEARNMEKVHLPPGMKADASRIAMSIYVDMVNGGQSLHDTILAVYLSGMHHGVEISRERIPGR